MDLEIGMSVKIVRRSERFGVEATATSDDGRVSGLLGIPLAAE